MMTCVWRLTKTSTAPPAPSGSNPALATGELASSSRLDVDAGGLPDGYTLTNPMATPWSTVRLVDTAPASAGTAPPVRPIERVSPVANGPAPERLSEARYGRSATNRPVVDAGAASPVMYPTTSTMAWLDS